MLPMPPQRPSTGPAVVEHSYELLTWVDARLAHLPAHVRAALGGRALTAVVDLLDALLVAAFAPRGAPTRDVALGEAQRHVALLRYLLRALRDGRHLSLEQHAHAVTLLDTIGRAAGAWRKAP